MPVFQGEQPPSFVEFAECGQSGRESLSFDVIAQNSGYSARGNGIHFERKVLERWVVDLGRVVEGEPIEAELATASGEECRIRVGPRGWDGHFKVTILLADLIHLHSASIHVDLVTATILEMQKMFLRCLKEKH